MRRFPFDPHKLVDAEAAAAAHREGNVAQQAADVRGGVQPELADQLDCVLRRLHQRRHRRAHAQDVLAVRRHPGHTRVQGQGLRVHTLLVQGRGDPRHRGHAQQRGQRPDGQVLLGQGERRARARGAAARTT